MKHLFITSWLVLMIGLWSFEWTRTLMLGLIALGVFSMALGLVFSILGVIWDVARRWLVGSHIGLTQDDAGQMHPSA